MAASNVRYLNGNYGCYNYQAFANISANFCKNLISGDFTTLTITVKIKLSSISAANHLFPTIIVVH